MVGLDPWPVLACSGEGVQDIMRMNMIAGYAATALAVLVALLSLMKGSGTSSFPFGSVLSLLVLLVFPAALIDVGSGDCGFERHMMSLKMVGSLSVIVYFEFFWRQRSVH